MSRLHDALRRANDGQSPILPADAGAAAGEGPEPGQSAFTVPWTIENTGSEPRAGADASASPARPRAAFVPSDDRRRHSTDPATEEKLVRSEGTSADGGLGIAMEQYRKLAATLHQAQGERGLKVLLVTSAGPGEGKSLTATNLALTLSESYQRRVLLIDGDLRRPSLHEIFGVSNTGGLTDGLARTSARRLEVVEASPRLSILLSGRPMADPTTTISSPQMREVIDEARANYDWTIIDTPPVGLLSDARLFAAMVDGVVLVVQAGRTSYLDAQRAVDAVERERVLGVVLNRLADGFGEASYYRSYYARAGGRQA